jgi:hypothetical protein
MPKSAYSLALLLSFVVIAGCGGSGPTGTVTGKVTKDGQPVAAQVSFKGETGTASGVSDAATGVYTLSTGESNAIVAGKYQIAVSDIVASESDPAAADYAKMMEGGNSASTAKAAVVPAKYNSFGSSGLECTVTEGPNTVDITLE